MLQTLLEFLKDKCPMAFICLGIAILCIYLTYKFMTWKHKIEDDLHSNNSCIKNLPCDKHATKIDNINPGKIDQRLDSIERILNRWNDTMISRSFSQTSMLEKHSPYTLTPSGKVLLELCGGKKVIDENFNYYEQEIGKKNHDSVLDIEKSSIESLLDSFNEKFMVDVKNYIYNLPEKITIEVNGEQKEAKVSPTDIQMIMSIYLRDKYLAQHWISAIFVPGKPNN